ARETINPSHLKRQLGRELVRIYHSSEAAMAAEEEFDRMFKGRGEPDVIRELTLAIDTPTVGVIRLLTETRLASSNSEARRLIEQGGVTIDGNRITDPNAAIRLNRWVTVRVGKRNFLKVHRADPTA
ncbi:tyrosine--tRNA ligase, partial [bacterium]|nr:tyrosine--tRNA ligase [bacterium]